MSIGHALLGILARGPAHGYDLKREHDTRFPGAKPLAYGQVYATLARLERDGHAEIAETAQGGGPERTVYAMTPEGRRTLDDWLEQVEPAGPYPADELVRKTITALHLGTDAAGSWCVSARSTWRGCASSSRHRPSWSSSARRSPWTTRSLISMPTSVGSRPPRRG